jgi:CheY-like chemotaxis protein
VLIVDDILTNLVVAEGLMAHYRMRIDSSLSGRESLNLIQERAAQNEYYDIVFIDHMMPDMDGIETAHAILALADTTGQERFKTLPLVALTANAIVGMRETFLQNDFIDYIVKPIEVAKLDECIRAWIPLEKRLKASALNDQAKSATVLAPSDDNPLIREIAKIPEIDIDDALTHVRTQENFIKVLRQLAAESDSYIQNIQAAFEKEDWPDYTIRVHAVKGVLGTVGMTALASRARALEFAAKEGDYAQCRNGTAALLEALAQFKAALLATSLGEKKTVLQSAVSVGVIIEKLDALYTACYHFKSDDVERLVEELAVLRPYGTAMKDGTRRCFDTKQDFVWDTVFANIRALCESLDYDAAAEAVVSALAALRGT